MDNSDTIAFRNFHEKKHIRKPSHQHHWQQETMMNWQKQFEESERIRNEMEVQLRRTKQQWQAEVAELQLQTKLLKQQILEERHIRKKERMRVDSRLQKLDTLSVYGHSTIFGREISASMNVYQRLDIDQPLAPNHGESSYIPSVDPYMVDIIQLFEKKMNDAHEEIKRRDEQIDLLTSQIEMLQNEPLDTIQRVNSKEKAMPSQSEQELKKQALFLKDQLISCEQNLASISNERNMLAKTNAMLEKKLDRTKQRAHHDASSLATQKNITEDIQKSLVNEVDQTRMKLKTERQRNQQLEKTIQQLLQEVNDTKNDRDKLMATLKQFQQQLRSIEMMMKDLHAERDNLRKLYNQTTDQLSRLQRIQSYSSKTKHDGYNDNHGLLLPLSDPYESKKQETALATLATERDQALFKIDRQKQEVQTTRQHTHELETSLLKLRHENTQLMRHVQKVDDNLHLLVGQINGHQPSYMMTTSECKHSMDKHGTRTFEQPPQLLYDEKSRLRTKTMSKRNDNDTSIEGESLIS
ncbi:hypothetical protein BDF19DRAFT_197075 [Syncephalis fuscata]|nr:hypothetical protein BDF19DRAFT_197075 [Syncephalis fuscata]